MTTKKVQELILKFGKETKNTGASEVQVALWSERISHLTEHFKTHRKDHASRRGLMQLIGKRRRMLNYISKCDKARYKKLISELGIRK